MLDFNLVLRGSIELYPSVAFTSIVLRVGHFHTMHKAISLKQFDLLIANGNWNTINRTDLFGGHGLITGTYENVFDIPVPYFPFLLHITLLIMTLGLLISLFIQISFLIISIFMASSNEIFWTLRIFKLDFYYIHQNHFEGIISGLR